MQTTECENGVMLFNISYKYYITIYGTILFVKLFWGSGIFWLEFFAILNSGKC